VTVWPGRGEPQLLGRTPARAHKREARMTQVMGETTLRAILAGAPDAATALIAPETERQWSYGALRAQVAALAARLAAMGIRRGDRVAIVLPNGPEIVAAFLAVVHGGAVAAPLNPAYTPDEFTFYF